MLKTRIQKHRPRIPHKFWAVPDDFKSKRPQISSSLAGVRQTVKQVMEKL